MPKSADLAMDPVEAPPSFTVTSKVSLQSRALRVLKSDDSFAVLDASGDILLGVASAQGVYHRDTRHLSHFAIGINGMRPLLLTSRVRDDNSALTCDYTNPQMREDGEVVLEQDLIHITRAQFLWKGALYERIAVRNFDESQVHSVTIDFGFAADFADVFEVRGLSRAKRGRIHQPEISASEVLLAYTGLDHRTRTTRLSFDPKPHRIQKNHAQFRFKLEPDGHAIIHVVVRCDGGSGRRRPREAFLSGLRASRSALYQTTSRAALIETSNEIYNEASRRSIADLYMLMTRTGVGLFPYAGIPWYSTIFGRDALITALLMLWLDPDVARGVLRYLALNQATGFDPSADAEPGKILHEVRYSEMAETGEVPFGRYYGSIDSTPLFLMLAGAYLDRTDDLATIRELWPHLKAALAWIDEYGDRDGDGFVEYRSRTVAGLANQGWKDSYDSIFHADGRLAEGPIALVEVQAYVYGAKVEASSIARRLGFAEVADDLARQADELRKRFHEAFWSEEIGTYALALDGRKERCLVRTSNAGHALLTGIVPDDCASTLVQTLMERESFSGWGIRTVATGAARYNPMSYHNGSVWPHDNALIALGLARYGFKHEAGRLFEALFHASTYFDSRRLPELFCGFSRRRNQGPTLYPVACSPQAWAAAAPLALIQACLGLRIQTTLGTVNLYQPMLPEFLDVVTIRRLSCGPVKLDVRFRRAGDQISMHVLNATGEARVTIAMPLRKLNALQF